ncbi:hypothetical protein AQUCO_01300035v1 [Aquilegia coerulea]|uniref:ATP synthase delta chain, chloroplastic n=1 Tax=Aquilegia coerulea TaxID=218851 RepID=A0A2G5DZF2_AQUCA|nr:hypothetical protein AQUCO_01300035v1 [Aquilegia coerulea]
METLPSSVSTLKIHGLSSTTHREVNLLKPPNTSHHFPPHSHIYNKLNPISNGPTTTTTSSFIKKVSFSSPLHFSTPTPLLKTVSPVVHRKKATSGYAAALIDIARCNDTLNVVEKDVRRLMKFLRNGDLQALLVDPSIDDSMKGQVMNELLEKGRFQKHLVLVLRMLVEKNKVGIVQEMLEEFERIYDELNGTQIVLVSSAKKIGQDRLLRIATKVQKMSGAMKVKVRNFIKERSPSFAVL